MTWWRFRNRKGRKLKMKNKNNKRDDVKYVCENPLIGLENELYGIHIQLEILNDQLLSFITLYKSRR